jgi:hypothetical protein
MEQADVRFLDMLPPWERAKLVAMPDTERVTALKKVVNNEFHRFGTTAVRSPNMY